MSDKTENVRIQLYINNEKAQAALREMDKEYNKLRASQKKFAAGSEDWQKLQKEIDGVTAKQIAFRKTMDLSSMSLRQLEGHSRQLKASFAHMIPNTPEFTAMRDRIGEVDARIKTVRSGLGPFAQAWKNVSGEVKGVITAFAMMAGSQVLSWFKGLITGAGDLSDQLANIRRLAGLSAEEVAVLNKELGSIKTRTATKDLREMAATAGQFGVAKEDIAGFVEQVDKINVVMGSEFGGNAQLVAETLAKLRNVLTDIKSSSIDKDLSHIGNALTVLAQEGVATAPVIADFSNRISGLGMTLGLTSGQVLGISATMQELNISVERGGTAIGKILQKMFSNVGEFAKIAGMEVKDFQQLMNNDLYGAFVKVLQGSQELGGSSVELAAIIKDLEVQGAGASEVIAKLGSNTELMGQKVTLAGGALKETTAITEQFNLQNSTLGATLDILRKDFAKLFTNDTVQNALKAMVLGFVKVVAVLRALPTFLKDNKDAIWLLAAAIATFNGQLIASRAAALADIAVKKIQEIWILRAEIAQAALNRTMKANPILAITGLILGAVAAYKIFTNSAAAAREEQEKLNEKIKEGQDLLKKTKPIEERYNAINKLSKESLNVLKNDIQQEIEAYNVKDAELVTLVEKSGYYKSIASWENEIAELKASLNAETFDKERKYYDDIIEEEKGLADKLTTSQLGLTRTQIQEGIKRFENMQKEVDTKLASFKTSADKEIEIEDKKEKEISQVAKKAANSRLVEISKNLLRKLNAREDFQETVKLALMDENNKEIYLEAKKWQELIDQAKEYGYDTCALETAQGVAIAAITEKQAAERLKNLKESGAEEKKTWQDDLNDIINIVDQFYSQVSSIINGVQQIAQNEADAELQAYTEMTDKKKAALQSQLDHNLITQQQFNEKMSALDKAQLEEEKAVKTEMWKKEHEAAIITATIDMALSIAKSLASAPVPYNFILAGLAAAAGAVQIAAIESQPMPAFAKGEEYVNGPGTGTSDSIPARLSKGERIVPADINAQLKGIPNRLLPKMLNFDFNKVMQRSTMQQSSSGMQSASSSNSDKLLQALIREVIDLKKTVKNKKDWVETDISIVGRKGLVKKQADYEETKKLSNI